MKSSIKLLAFTLIMIQANMIKAIEFCPDCTKSALLHEAPAKNNQSINTSSHVCNAKEQCPDCTKSAQLHETQCTHAIEQCPDCTKSAQLHDATHEVNQLAQSAQHTLSRPHIAACNCMNGGACTCPQGQCHCSTQCHNQSSDDALEQTVLSSFATMVQSIFNIAQNPRNSQVVGVNIAQMLAGIVNVAKEVIHRMPESITMEEKEAYLEEVELALKRCLRSLARMRKQLA